MSWLSPRTVRGWFVLIVLGALIVSQLASLALLASQQTILRSALHEAEAFRRTAGIVTLAKNADEQTRQTIETDRQRAVVSGALRQRAAGGGKTNAMRG